MSNEHAGVCTILLINWMGACVYVCVRLFPFTAYACTLLCIEHYSILCMYGITFTVEYSSFRMYCVCNN